MIGLILNFSKTFYYHIYVVCSHIKKKYNIVADRPYT